MGRTGFQYSVLIAACAALASCAAMPSAGPSASAITKQAAHLETVSPQDAAARWASQKSVEQQRINDTLAALAVGGEIAPLRLSPGAKLDVTLWTEPQLGDSSSSDSSEKHEATMKTELGTFVVGDDGALRLPYAGPAVVTGLDLTQAAHLLSRRFGETRKFQDPEITLAMKANPHQQIVVAGSANHPTVVNWREGGVSLGEAIAEAGGSVIYEQGQSHALTANHVVVVRQGARYDLPLKTALETEVQLRPDDQVLLEHQAVVNIHCLGGGWTQNTVQSFDEVPTLSRVVATGGGLSSQQAQGRQVFVLSADRQVIYQFNWNTLDGLQAAQTFPLQDGDILYIATAPIVRIQQVANILFSAAYPVAAVRSID